MVKARISALDLRTVVQECRSSLLGLRLANIYDRDGKTYLLKFSKPDVKILLLIEAGVRVHTTDYQQTRGQSELPSAFSMKLRKHIRTWRLESIEQLGGSSAGHEGRGA